MLHKDRFKLVAKKDVNFTTQTFGWVHMYPLNNNAMTSLSLLRRMLGQTNAFYLDQQSFRTYLQSLYGVYLSIQASKEYNLLVTRISLHAIKGSIIKQPEFDITAIEIMLEAIFKPTFINPEFASASQALFIQEKNRLRIDLKTKADEPNRFLTYEFFKMFGNHHANIDPAGDLKTLESLTLNDIQHVYKQWISYPGTFFYHGQVPSQKLRLTLSRYDFPVITSSVEKKPATLRYEPFVKKTLQTQFNQTQMRIMYASEVKRLSKDAYSLVVFNEMFGGNSESYLFQEVREKQQLCYQIGSQFVPDYGAVSVVIGTHQKTLNKAIKLIDKQLNRIQHGDFSDDFFKRMKLSIIESHRRAQDYPSYHLELIHGKILHETTLYSFEYIEKIKAINRHDVIAVSQRLRAIKQLVLLGKN